MKIGICDDDKQMMNLIKQMILAFPSDKVDWHIECFDSGRAIVASETIFDLVILDVQMPEMDGIEVAKHLQEKDWQTMIMFVSSHAGYNRMGYRLGAFQFLIKPFDQETFHEELQRAVEHYEQNHRTFKGANKDTVFALPLGDIVYFKVEGRQIIVHTQDGGTHQTYGRINQIETQLEADHFVRCDRSYLVNLKYVDKVGEYDLTLKSGYWPTIPVSRRNNTAVKRRLNGYLARVRRDRP